MAALRRFMHLDDYLGPIHFENLGKLLLVMSLIWAYFVFAERLTIWYGNNPPEVAVFLQTQRGSFAPLFWTMIACNLIVPFTLLAFRALRTIKGCVIASVSVCAGMWLERFLIIVPSLGHKYLPYDWGRYRPRPVEIVITVSTFAAMGLMYSVFVKLVPVISIWELAAEDSAPGVEPGDSKGATLRPVDAGPSERCAAGDLLEDRAV
jgi:molybdopterin-containing oxidoreductase family membrane subunit